MANQERGEVGITVGERRYTLRPTFDALCNLEDLADKSVDQIVRDVDEGRLSGLRALVWVLLQDEHAAEFQTLKQASEWIVEAGGADAILPVLHELLGLNQGDAVEGQSANPPTAQGDGAGGRSPSMPDGSAWAKTSGGSRRGSSGTRSKRSNTVSGMH